MLQLPGKEWVSSKNGGKTSPIISIFTDFLSFAFNALSVFVCKPGRKKWGKSFSYSITFCHLLWCFYWQNTCYREREKLFLGLSGANYNLNLLWFLESFTSSLKFLLHEVKFFPASHNQKHIKKTSTVNFSFNSFFYLLQLLLCLTPDSNFTTYKIQICCLFLLCLQDWAGAIKKLRINRIEFIWCVVGVYRQEKIRKPFLFWQIYKRRKINDKAFMSLDISTNIFHSLLARMKKTEKHSQLHKPCLAAKAKAGGKRKTDRKLQVNFINFIIIVL